MSYPFRDWSHHGLVKFLIWLLVASFVLVLLVCLFVPIIIDRNLVRAEARLSAEGEQTDYLSLLPPSLPLAGNFFALPELQNIPLVDAEDEPTNVHEEHRAPLLKMGEGLEKIPHHLIATPDWLKALTGMDYPSIP